MGQIHGCKIAGGAPVISHLFFAEHSYFFFQAQVEEARKIHDVLKQYEFASGQLINFQKSSMIFSSNVQTQQRTAIITLIGVPKSIRIQKYLGLPAMVGRNKQEMFSYIKNSMWGKIRSWNR